jgi:hypothetical protein
MRLMLNAVLVVVQLVIAALAVSGIVVVGLMLVVAGRILAR